MKKFIVGILALVLLIGTLPTYANTKDSKTLAVDTIKAMGIVKGDVDGTVRLNQLIRRAEFTQVLLNASAFKSSASGTMSTSVFTDVKYDHWAAGAIRTATQNGWISGYLDGSFRPNQFVTYEEAASSILKVLGYNSQDFYDNTPAGALLKFQDLSLDNQINRSRGEYINRENLMMMVYNMMHTATKSGTVYGTTLGYVVPLNYAQLVEQHMKGPFVNGSDAILKQLPFSEKNTIVYRNGSLSSLNAIRPFDVYYYNQNTKTVWAYSKKVTGIYASATPSIASPTAVIVAGSPYTIGNPQAAYKLSNTGTFPLGTAVTLLLGKNGEVVDVVTPSTINESGVGVVLESSKQTFTDGSGKMFVENTIQWVATDGLKRETVVGKEVFNKGDLVSVTWTADAPLVKKISNVPLTGNVDAAGEKINQVKFADSVEIIDVTPAGEFASIFSSRLAGASLGYSDVKYYSKNASGEIDKIILNNLTGDFNTYGIVTDKKESTVVIPSGDPMIPDVVSQTGLYTYQINGITQIKQTSGSLIDVGLGPVVFIYKDGQVDRFTNLGGFSVTTLSALEAQNGQKAYALADKVQVYQKIGSAYYLINLETILNTNDYHLMAYYDSGFRLGGKVRIIIATEKNQ